MTQPEETEMDTNDTTTTRTAAPVAVIELGVASIETQGIVGMQNEELGFTPALGISAD